MRERAGNPRSRPRVSPMRRHAETDRVPSLTHARSSSLADMPATVPPPRARLAALAAAVVARPTLARIAPPARIAVDGAPADTVPADTTHVRVERVADGVYAVLRTDPPGLMFEANGAF